MRSPFLRRLAPLAGACLFAACLPLLAADTVPQYFPYGEGRPGGCWVDLEARRTLACSDALTPGPAPVAGTAPTAAAEPAPGPAAQAQPARPTLDEITAARDLARAQAEAAPVVDEACMAWLTRQGHRPVRTVPGICRDGEEFVNCPPCP